MITSMIANDMEEGRLRPDLRLPGRREIMRAENGAGRERGGKVMARGEEKQIPRCSRDDSAVRRDNRARHEYIWWRRVMGAGCRGSDQAEGFEVVEGLGEGAGADCQAEGFARGG
jgi:hypothetical protein